MVPAGAVAASHPEKPPVADRTVEGALFVEGGGAKKGIPVLRTDRLAGGVHLLRITAEDFTATERVTVVR
jgi:hypothetical protein